MKDNIHSELEIIDGEYFINMYGEGELDFICSTVSAKTKEQAYKEIVALAKTYRDALDRFIEWEERSMRVRESYEEIENERSG